MTNPKVTVLMTVYNEEKYIRDAVDSVLNQTFPDFELLIVNDASKDSTMTILEEYNDPRIRLISNEKNLGCPKSSNKGLKSAKGKYIARLDGDDICFPNRLKIQYEFMEKHPDIDVLGTSTEVINEKGERIAVWRNYFLPEVTYFLLHFRNCLTHSSVMYKAQFARDIGGYNEDIKWGLDYDFFYRASRSGKLYVIHPILVKYREITEKIRKKKSGQNFTVEKIVRDNFYSLIGKDIDQTTIEILSKPKFCNFKNFNLDQIIFALIYFTLIKGKIIKNAPSFLNRHLINPLTSIDYFLQYYYRQNRELQFHLPSRLKVQLKIE